MSYSVEQDPQDMGVDPKTNGKPSRSVVIEALASGGRGVGRVDGTVWFIPGTLPGDRVQATPDHLRERYVEARLVRIEHPSELRREPPCSLQHECGGCPWMQLEDAQQREWKRRILEDAMVRIGKFNADAVRPVEPGPRVLGYRNKIELTVGTAFGGETVLGMHRSGRPGEIVEVERCLLQHDEPNVLLADLARDLRGIGGLLPLAANDLFRVVIRRSWSTGDLLVLIRETGPEFPEAARLAERWMQRHQNLKGVVRLRALAGRRGGTRTVVVRGQGWLEESLADFRFRLPAASFVQVNPEMTGTLLELVLEQSGAVRGDVLDLYGGVGLYGLTLARRGARSVAVCEADREAIRAGKKAARRNRVQAIRYVHSDVRQFLGQYQAPAAPDLIVANPPRSGFGKGVAQAIAKLAPRRVAVVSCDPATMARDLRALVDRGYRLRHVTPVDLFPQTAHIESVAALERGA